MPYLLAVLFIFSVSSLRPSSVLPIISMSLVKCKLFIVVPPQLFYLHSCSTSTVALPPQLFYLHSCSTSTVVLPPQLFYLHSCFLSFVILSDLEQVEESWQKQTCLSNPNVGIEPAAVFVIHHDCILSFFVKFLD